MKIEQVHAEDWQQWVAEHDGVIVDVREPVEWAQGTLPGSRTIPLMELPAHLDELDSATPLLIVCRSGNRSQHAARYLASQGYQAANLRGGLKKLGMAR